MIVLARLGDEGGKRAYASGEDAYRVFVKMLRAHPPSDRDQRLAEAETAARI